MVQRRLWKSGDSVSLSLTLGVLLQAESPECRQLACRVACVRVAWWTGVLHSSYQVLGFGDRFHNVGSSEVRSELGPGIFVEALV